MYLCGTKDVNKMKRLFYLVLLLPAFFAACSDFSPTARESEHVDTIPFLVTQVQKCAKLYTAEYKVHKIVTHDDQMKLKGTFMAQEFNITLPIGERRIAIPIDATLKAYVDFSAFSADNVKRKGNKLEIVLPDPKVELVNTKINHAEIKKQVPLLRASFTDEEMTNYENQGRAAIINDVPKMGILAQAQENAANTLIPLLANLGFNEEDITITFRKTFSADDLPKLFDSNQIKK